ncbi:MAG: DUF2155 domain-containing protein [Holosporales bacterium]|jgi:hypothetical protein|nr:DUF2155 domain-containing protein [Holosporales bacterium]
MKVVVVTQYLTLAFLSFVSLLVHSQEATIDVIEGSDQSEISESEKPKAFQAEEPLPIVNRLEAGSPMPILTVHVRLLDKISCQYLHALLHVGRLYAFGRLRILVLKAFANAAEEYPEIYAFLKIWEIPLLHAEFGPKKKNSQESAVPSIEKDAQGTEKTLVFSGWMFASSPAIAPLEHPVYDIRLEQKQDNNQQKNL